jgi:hypothetical protein
MKRLMCEWFHVNYWFGIAIHNHEGEFCHVRIKCTKCEREWQASYMPNSRGSP